MKRNVHRLEGALDWIQRSCSHFISVVLESSDLVLKYDMFKVQCPVSSCIHSPSSFILHPSSSFLLLGVLRSAVCCWFCWPFIVDPWFEWTNKARPTNRRRLWRFWLLVCSRAELLLLTDHEQKMRRCGNSNDQRRHSSFILVSSAS